MPETPALGPWGLGVSERCPVPTLSPSIPFSSPFCEREKNPLPFHPSPSPTNPTTRTKLPSVFPSTTRPSTPTGISRTCCLLYKTQKDETKRRRTSASVPNPPPPPDSKFLIAPAPNQPPQQQETHPRRSHEAHLPSPFSDLTTKTLSSLPSRRLSSPSAANCCPATKRLLVDASIFCCLIILPATTTRTLARTTPPLLADAVFFSIPPPLSHLTPASAALFWDPRTAINKHPVAHRGNPDDDLI
ncbi:hypothetical protein B0J13DRAFT_10189 [Dactylonectria estremocensis]|uniref:Uncharacterized protein n=1 Tax=Dactylonectria estremocensis TaxID=1079267 RepID=A0A9P9FIR3_9HYPO|nr:hypothetical protein B0J13DRAFT_10189 [Dactylonectria estremocensis]